MTMIRILVDGDEAMPEIDPEKVIRTDPSSLTICGLPGGSSGEGVSVAFFAKTLTGEWVMIETTLRNFQAANGALRGRYGDV